MDLEEEKYFVSLGMRKLGGSFVKALGEALLHAHPSNVQKIKETWPVYWEQYLKNGQYNIKMSELKTLKDLDEVYTNEWNEKHYDKFGEKVLDTKEIKIIDDRSSRFVKFEELKKEAIKWVKSDKVIACPEVAGDLPVWKIKEIQNVVVKYRNNITEEDLK